MSDWMTNKTMWEAWVGFILVLDQIRVTGPILLPCVSRVARMRCFC